MNFLRLIKSESYKKGTVLSVLFNIISKGILFLLTIIIARYFGSNIKTDIYFFVFAAMILFSGFVNSLDTAVLIPESMRLRENEGDDAAAAFLNFFLLVYLAIGIVFIIIMYFFGTTVFGFISKFSKADILIYRNYFWIGSFFFIFHILTNYLNNVLTSLKFFSIPMIISSIKSCIAILCIFLLKADYDVLSIFLGGLIAYAFNLIILLFVMKRTAHWKFTIRSSGIKRSVRRNMLYAELGQMATVASSMFPLYLLSGFGGGVISVMNYGKNIADIPNTLITAQFANVSGIKLNEEFAQQDYAAMNDTFLRISKILVFMLVPVGCFLFVFAEPVIELFYKSGNFTATAIADSTKFLQLLVVTIFSIAVNTMVSRLFIAAQLIKQAFLYQVVMNCLLIIFIWLLSKYYGAYGYPYGVILVNTVNYLSMYFICKKYFKAIQYGTVLTYTGLVILINVPVAVILFYTLQVTGFFYLYNLLLGAGIYLFLFFMMSRIKKIRIQWK